LIIPHCFPTSNSQLHRRVAAHRHCASGSAPRSRGAVSALEAAPAQEDRAEVVRTLLSSRPWNSGKNSWEALWEKYTLGTGETWENGENHGE